MIKVNIQLGELWSSHNNNNTAIQYNTIECKHLALNTVHKTKAFLLKTNENCIIHFYVNTMHKTKDPNTTNISKVPYEHIGTDLVKINSLDIENLLHCSIFNSN